MIIKKINNFLKNNDRKGNNAQYYNHLRTYAQYKWFNLGSQATICD